jgi:hypothetical protein
VHRDESCCASCRRGDVNNVAIEKWKDA